MDYFLVCLPMALSAVLGMTLELKFMVDSPSTYWALGAFGAVLTFQVAALVRLS